jgi:SET domain-containing protein
MRERVRTGPSMIAGQGLFAAEPISAGTPVDAAGANHSCDPNLWWDGDVLVALRDVTSGEELTHDYATGPMGPGELLRCNCGSMRCRGLIESGDRDIPELRRRYSGHFHSAG